MSNVAVTDFSLSMVTEQLVIPVHPAPDHPAKYESMPAAGTSVSGVVALNITEQLPVQEMPGVKLFTDPLPIPANKAFRKY